MRFGAPPNKVKMPRAQQLMLDTASLRVAADGGANRLHELSSFQGKFVSITISRDS